ncbi:MAG TPA: carboxypeptidase regulatory-like domain-containing protein [Candidatus Ozemobacteraceae bacterium]|nr:carboxypeptidase regulatory-like domain-containing protein [Candidatus Ozemobacteraceae bacterium]HQG29452.1 carboxypeptidase regulatory-like domain-containing protein [Candidatus Ozemobacteraceae bacterium]
MLKRYQVFLALVLGVALLTAAGCGTSTSLRGSITGTIVDSQTGIGISAASVMTSPSTTTVKTDINGNFTIPDVQPGVYTVTANATDYNSNSITVTVDNGLTATTNLTLVSMGGSFSRNVLPILMVNCSIVGCHDDSTAAAGLRLNSYTSLMKGSRYGAVIYPYDAQSSKLIKRIKGIETPRMPKNRSALSTADQGLLSNWINGGARNN